jgi:hypothetical protein
LKGDFTRWTFDPAKHYHGVLKQQGRVDLDADWNEQNALAAHRTETETVDVVGSSGAPMGDAGFLLTVINNGAKLQISKGRAYVDGLLCANEQDVAIDAQADLPGFRLPTAAGMYAAYLMVWLRHLTGLDDAEMLEAALGGADTCTRAKTVWQVRLSASLGAVGSAVNCTTPVPDLTPPASPTLMARAEPSDTADSPCAIPAKAGYRSLENQLYRVEIHDGGDVSGGNVTYKWSRDNGSVVTSWTGLDATRTILTVASVGRDDVLGFAAGQWIELTDDTRELNFQTGTLVQLTNVQGLTLTIDPTTARPSGALDFTKFPGNPKVRRWDSAGVIAVQAGQWVAVENGVQVNFGTGTASAGDYWLIPARTLTADIDWPRDSSGNPLAEPPVGIRRHFCRLAVVQFDGKVWSVVTRCLPLFPPLTTITQGKGIHVLGVQVGRGESFSPLLNDSNVAIAELEGTWEIRVLCDAAIDPVSAQPTTCFLTLELPYPLDVLRLLPNGVPQGQQAELYGFQPLVVPARVNAGPVGNTKVISLQFDGVVYAIVHNLLQAGFVSRLVARLTLKGNFLWGQADPSTYLDGAAFGVARRDPDGARIGLNLPSGNGVPGSDFTMWFWFFRPIRVKSVTLSSPVNVGQSSSGFVTLDGYAPPNTTVALTASPYLGTLSPASVPVQTGKVEGSFQVNNTTVPAGAASAVMTVTATYAGSTAQGSLTINQVIRLVSLTFSPSTVLEEQGGNTTGTVTLNVAAPANGALVTLHSNSNNLQVPASVLIPANKTSHTFPARGINVPGNNSVTVLVTATYANTIVQASVEVRGQFLH